MPHSQPTPNPQNDANAYPSNLPSRYYFDPDIYKREVEEIFYKSWYCSPHRSELTAPGDFVTTEVCDQSVIAVRGEDGAVRCFHNVCRHRGTRLIDARRGRLERYIRCPYHAWTYALSGELHHAPRSEAVKGFEANRYPLRAVQAEEFAGFYFFNLHPDSPPFSAQTESAEALMRQYFPDLDDLEYVDSLDHEVDANWKVIVDNAIEGYHFKLSGPVHKELAALIQFDRYELVAKDKFWFFRGPPNAERPTTAFGESIGGSKFQSDWFFNIQFWPATTFYVFPFADFVGTFNEFPLGPERTRLRLGYYRPKRPASPVTEACMKWMSHALGPEDIELNVAQQKGLRSLGFEQGPYMIDEACSNTSEHLLAHFHSLIREALATSVESPSTRLGR